MPTAEEKRALIQSLEQKLGCSLRTLAELLQEETQTDLFKTPKIRKDIDSLMREIGFPANLKGYNCICKALEICLVEDEYLHNITKMLYPRIAEEFNTTSSKVERAIRHSIEVAWRRGNVEYIDKIFGYSISPSKAKPSNGEFLATCVEFLRRNLNSL